VLVGVPVRCSTTVRFEGAAGLAGGTAGGGGGTESAGGGGGAESAGGGGTGISVTGLVGVTPDGGAIVLSPQR